MPDYDDKISISDAVRPYVLRAVPYACSYNTSRHTLSDRLQSIWKGIASHDRTEVIKATIDFMYQELQIQSTKRMDELLDMQPFATCKNQGTELFPLFPAFMPTRKTNTPHRKIAQPLFLAVADHDDMYSYPETIVAMFNYMVSIMPRPKNISYCASLAPNSNLRHMLVNEGFSHSQWHDIKYAGRVFIKQQRPFILSSSRAEYSTPHNPVAFVVNVIEQIDDHNIQVVRMPFIEHVRLAVRLEHNPHASIRLSVIGTCAHMINELWHESSLHHKDIIVNGKKLKEHALCVSDNTIASLFRPKMPLTRFQAPTSMMPVLTWFSGLGLQEKVENWKFMRTELEFTTETMINMLHNAIQAKLAAQKMMPWINGNTDN